MQKHNKNKVEETTKTIIEMDQYAKIYNEDPDAVPTIVFCSSGQNCSIVYILGEKLLRYRYRDNDGIPHYKFDEWIEAATFSALIITPSPYVRQICNDEIYKLIDACNEHNVRVMTTYNYDNRCHDKDGQRGIDSSVILTPEMLKMPISAAQSTINAAGNGTTTLVVEIGHFRGKTFETKLDEHRDHTPVIRIPIWEARNWKDWEDAQEYLDREIDKLSHRFYLKEKSQVAGFFKALIDELKRKYGPDVKGALA